MLKISNIQQMVKGPFRFVHASPSFVNEDQVLIGVFVYEINDDYISLQDSNLP